jgi:histone acetyltransferase (RNA polymerase elongator complex component)
MKHYNIPIFIPHLGCPFNCIFCNQKRIASLVPAPDPDLVLDMVQSALKSLPVLSQGREIEVAYYGGSFTALDQDLQEKYLLALQSCLKQSDHQLYPQPEPKFLDQTASIHCYLGTITPAGSRQNLFIKRLDSQFNSTYSMSTQQVQY